jgi:predicted DNA binding protein
VRLLRSYPSRRLTWREIGDMLGITAQSAHARFRSVEGMA